MKDEIGGRNIIWGRGGRGGPTELKTIQQQEFNQRNSNNQSIKTTQQQYKRRNSSNSSATIEN